MLSQTRIFEKIAGRPSIKLWGTRICIESRKFSSGDYAARKTIGLILRNPVDGDFLGYSLVSEGTLVVRLFQKRESGFLARLSS